MTQIKKIGMTIALIVLLLCLNACGANVSEGASGQADADSSRTEQTDSEAESTMDTVEEEEPPSKDYIGFSGDVFDAHFEIVGAQSFVGKDGPIVFLYYDYTNYSYRSKNAMMSLNIDMTQGGEKLQRGSIMSGSRYEPVESKRQVLDIRPGVTLRIVDIFEYDPDGGMIEVTFSDTTYGQKQDVSFSMDPASFTEERPDLLPIQPVPDPQWTETIPEAEYVSSPDETIKYMASIVKTEFYQGYHGETMLRAYYEVENLCDETINAKSDLGFEAVAYQDGVQLWQRSSAFNGVEEESREDKVIEPGKTLLLADSFELHQESKSPVEIELRILYDQPFAGMVVPLNE